MSEKVYTREDTCVVEKAMDIRLNKSNQRCILDYRTMVQTVEMEGYKIITGINTV